MNKVQLLLSKLLTANKNLSYDFDSPQSHETGAWYLDIAAPKSSNIIVRWNENDDRLYIMLEDDITEDEQTFTSVDDAYAHVQRMMNT